MLSSIFSKEKDPAIAESFSLGMDLRGVEPLSESSQTRPSPSAVCGSEFPRADAHRQESARSSFMLRTHGKA